MADEKPAVAIAAAATAQPDAAAVAIASAPAAPLATDVVAKIGPNGVEAANPAVAARDINALPLNELTPAELEQVAPTRFAEFSAAQLGALSDTVKTAIAPNLATIGIQLAAAQQPVAAPTLVATDGAVAATKPITQVTTVNVDCNPTTVVAQPTEQTVVAASEPPAVIGTVGPGATWAGKEGTPPDSKQAALAQAALSTTSGRAAG
jgi:hypothetical protein